MSASASHSPVEAPDITCIAPDPFETKFLIADILRTGYCIPGSVFLVEGIDTLHTSRSKRWRVVRLLLGDGQLCIQALLSADMHRLVDRGEVAFGSYIKLEQFRLEWKEVSNAEVDSSSTDKGKGKDTDYQDAKNKMVYLVVDDLVLVGWNNTLVDSLDTRNVRPGIQTFNNEAKEDMEMDEGEAISSTANVISQRATGAQSFDSGVGLVQEAADADDDFEAMPNAAEKATQNRLDLATKSRNNEGKGFNSDILWSIIDSGKPIKITKLRSIPNLPYKQNWSVNILAVVSAISDVEPSGLPPYCQRQARLADPSTDKHILLTVFLDPEQFAPAVGSVVLLLGAKNHPFDGGSLKKYSSDLPKVGYSWWYENPRQFHWCDVDGLKRWWEESPFREQHE